MNRTPIIAALSSLLLATAAHAAIPVVLYDGSDTINPNKTLAQSPWNWTYGATPDTRATNPNKPESATVSAAAGVTTLNSTHLVASPVITDITAGFNISNASPFFGNANMPVLDPTGGFKLDFNVAVTAETAGDTTLHTDVADRAGFSVIVLTSNATGVEIGFRQNQIFTQTHDFHQATGTEINSLVSTTAMSSYELAIAGGNYTLTQNGSLVLSGSLRTYDAIAGAALPGSAPNDNVYHQQNYIFMGDDTTARSATVNIAYVALNPIPEPTSLTLLALGATGLLARRTRRA